MSGTMKTVKFISGIKLRMSSLRIDERPTCVKIKYGPDDRTIKTYAPWYVTITD